MVLALFIITIIVLACVFWSQPTTLIDWNWSDTDKRRSLLSAHPTGRRLLDNAGGVDAGGGAVDPPCRGSAKHACIPAMPAVGTSVDSIGGGRMLLQEGEDDTRAENIARFRADPLGYDGPWIQEVMSPSV